MTEAGPDLPACVIVITGPDGAGKSTLAAAVVAAAPPDKVLWLHHRPRLLPSRSGGTGEPVTDPYGQQPYPAALGALKVLYYWFDYVLGWMLRVRPLVRSGGAVVIERGWQDLAVDPRRYRLAGVEGLVTLLGRLLPRATRTFRLTGPAELLLSRTGDNLTLADLQGQLDAQARVLSGRDVVVLDAREPVAGLRNQVLQRVREARGAASQAPGAVPSASNPRWLLPRTPAPVAAGALRIHRPMTPHAAVVWRGARLAARGGAARLLPVAGDAAAPPGASVDRWVPAGGGVAVARSNHPGRSHALVVDARGAPVVHVKVAGDDAGRAALALEAEHLARFGPALPPPVRAPRLLHAEDGLLITEAVAWRWQRRPWVLDPAVAASLGGLWRTGGQSPSTGVAHGDAAPWNLLPLAGEWVLVDWEMAVPEAPPFFDLVHWIVMTQSHLRRPGMQAVRTGLRGAGWIGACIIAYAHAAGVPTSALSEGIRGYLERTAERTTAGSPQAAHEASVRAALGSATR